MNVSKPYYVNDLDSSAVMLKALAAYLHGREFPLVGVLPRWSATLWKPILMLVNRAPRVVKGRLYGRSAGIEAQKLQEIQSERVAAWFSGKYPRHPYPAVAIGSANGAAMHLCAALKIPWLPQTFMTLVGQSPGRSGEPFNDDIEKLHEPIRSMLDRNPDVQLHQSAKPDRGMRSDTTSLRIKYRRLPAAYQTFLEQTLRPGGTLMVIQCQMRCSARPIQERHLLQGGSFETSGLNDAEADRGMRSDPAQDPQSVPPAAQALQSTLQPDGEWGFEPELLEDLRSYCRRNNIHLRRIVFAEPDQLSPLVADLYRWWGRRRAIKEQRLLVESYLMVEPYWTIRSGVIPYWMGFNSENSARHLEGFLSRNGGFEEALMMLSTQETEAPELVPFEHWRALLKSSAGEVHFIGMDKHYSPTDLSLLLKYYFDLKKKLAWRYPPPAPLTLANLEDFLKQKGDQYAVDWPKVK